MGQNDHCCAVGCSTRRVKGKKIKFHFLPRKPTVRDRKDLVPSRDTCLCYKHFHNEEKSKDQPYPVYFSHKSYPLCRKAPEKRPLRKCPKSKPKKANANAKKPSSRSKLVQLMATEEHLVFFILRLACPTKCTDYSIIIRFRQ
eukprot:scpid92434/ scgid26665/ 